VGKKKKKSFEGNYLRKKKRLDCNWQDGNPPVQEGAAKPKIIACGPFGNPTVRVERQGGEKTVKGRSPVKRPEDAGSYLSSPA